MNDVPHEDTIEYWKAMHKHELEKKKKKERIIRELLYEKDKEIRSQKYRIKTHVSDNVKLGKLLKKKDEELKAANDRIQELQNPTVEE